MIGLLVDWIYTEAMPRPESRQNHPQPEPKLTETSSPYSDFDRRSSHERLAIINAEDKTIAQSVEKSLPQITALANKTIEQLRHGKRWFTIGAGTSGRLGVLDASELPPTYGVPENLVVGIIAGGDRALRHAVEGAEDDRQQGWLDLQTHGVAEGDVVLGITASGSTPYVLGALEKCRENGIITASITCNPNSAVETLSNYPIVCPVGAEVITGSTRMKAGTATKMILNMLSTNVMVDLGYVEGNDMVNMNPSNEKLLQRGTDMLTKRSGISEERARQLLQEHGSVQKALKVLGL